MGLPSSLENNIERLLQNQSLEQVNRPLQKLAEQRYERGVADLFNARADELAANAKKRAIVPTAVAAPLPRRMDVPATGPRIWRKFRGYWESM